jgi:hypothetical protein
MIGVVGVVGVIFVIFVIILPQRTQSFSQSAQIQII